FFLAFINAKLVNTNSPPRIPVLAELSPVCGSFLCCTLCFKLSLETLFTDPGFVVAIVFPLFPSFMFSDEIVLDRLSLKLSIRDALALKELDVLKLSLSLKDLLILSDSSVFIEELPLNELDVLKLSLSEELVLKDSLKLLDVLRLSLKDELVLKDSLNELDVLKLSLKDELVLKDSLKLLDVLRLSLKD